MRGTNGRFLVKAGDLNRLSRSYGTPVAYEHNFDDGSAVVPSTFFSQSLKYY